LTHLILRLLTHLTQRLLTHLTLTLTHLNLTLLTHLTLRLLTHLTLLGGDQRHRLGLDIHVPRAHGAVEDW
jgi:hypothetical protein